VDEVHAFPAPPFACWPSFVQEVSDAGIEIAGLFLCHRFQVRSLLHACSPCGARFDRVSLTLNPSFPYRSRSWDALWSPQHRHLADAATRSNRVVIGGHGYEGFTFVALVKLHCGIAQSSPIPGFVEPLVPTAAGISVQQVSFDLEAGRVAETDWGQMQVDPARWSEATGMTSGYINLFLYPDPGGSEGSWVVRNLFVSAILTSPCPPEDSNPPGGPSTPGKPSSDSAVPRQPLSIYFDLRPTSDGCGRVDAILAVILTSRQPLPEMREFVRVAAQFPAHWIPVVQVLENAEGELGDRVQTGPPPVFSAELIGPPPFVPPFPSLPTDLAFPIVIFQADAPNAHSAKNQCVPIAHANVLQYLETRYNALPLLWFLLQAHIPGIGKVSSAGDVLIWIPEPPDSLVANIDALTRRTGVISPSAGSGTGRCQQIRGVFGYLAANGAFAQATYRHQGGSMLYGEDQACDDGTVVLGGLVSIREGIQPTWNWMYQQLQSGRGLAMSFGRYDADGNRTSGHMVRVWGASRLGSKDYLYTLDDSNQGPNTTGLRTQQWEVADTGSPGAPGVPDGRLNMNGTSWEIEFAISAEAKPTLLIP
jgi:hypothetical protein